MSSPNKRTYNEMSQTNVEVDTIDNASEPLISLNDNLTFAAIAELTGVTLTTACEESLYYIACDAIKTQYRHSQFHITTPEQAICYGVYHKIERIQLLTEEFKEVFDPETPLSKAKNAKDIQTVLSFLENQPIDLSVHQYFEFAAVLDKILFDDITDYADDYGDGDDPIEDYITNFDNAVDQKLLPRRKIENPQPDQVKAIKIINAARGTGYLTSSNALDIFKSTVSNIVSS